MEALISRMPMSCILHCSQVSAHAVMGVKWGEGVRLVGGIDGYYLFYLMIPLHTGLFLYQNIWDDHRKIIKIN